MEKTKQSFFQRITKYVKEVKSEMKRVVWPTFAKIRQNTLVVMLYVLIIGIVIWLLDALFTWGISFIINR